MKGIKFGDYHSFNDLSLILTRKELGSPQIKSKIVNVDGAHSHIDYTEYFGEVKYDNMKHIFEFNSIIPQAQFLAQFSEVKNKLHGRMLKIVLDEEPDYFYLGRLTVSSFTNDKNIGVISIECDCKPWKYKKNETVVAQAINGSATIILQNSRMKVVPTIRTTASMTIDFDGNSATIGAGTYTIPTLELSEGANEVVVTGTGNITFTYQEGGL